MKNDKYSHARKGVNDGHWGNWVLLMNIYGI